MKKALFLVLLMAVWAVQSFACGPEMPDYDAYVFCLCPSAYTYSSGNDQRLADEWSKLVGSKVTVAQSRQLSQVSLRELDTLNNPVARYARKSKEVNDYLRLLVSYIETSRIVDDSWDYPDPDQMLQYNAQLKSQLAKASKYQGIILRERYYLLRLRIMFRMGDYEGILKQWETRPLTGSSVFVDMSRDLYAGALYHLGRNEDAAVQYAIHGNLFDAHVCMKDLHGASCIDRVAQHDPNSPVLPYMLEEIVNGFRESFEYAESLRLMRPFFQQGTCLPWEQLSSMDIAYDCYTEEGCAPNLYRITRLPSLNDWFQRVRPYKVQRDEQKLLEQVIDRQLDNHSVSDRCMWLSARAYLQYLQHDYAAAWDNIQKAVALPGAPLSNQNARFLRMLISTRQSDIALMERTVVDGLSEFLSPSRNYDWSFKSPDGIYDYYTEDCLYHLVARGIVARYLSEGDSAMAAMAWSLVSGRYNSLEYYSHITSVGNEHFDEFCNLSIDKQKKLLDFIQHPDKASSTLLRFLLRRLPFPPYDYLDVVGTNLIRDGRFAEAIPFLEQVPLDFLSHQPIAPYAAKRSFRDTPWERISVDEFEDHRNLKLTTNAKVDFCKEVVKWQNNLAFSSGEDRLLAAYKLGELYHQASILGHCWWLAYYGVSNFSEYNLRLEKDHFGFVDHSRALLVQALSSSNQNLRYKAYYLLLTQGHDDLLRYEWDDNVYEYRSYLNKESKYYSVLKLFRNDLYGRPGEPSYVSLCDNLVQLYKMM